MGQLKPTTYLRSALQLPREHLLEPSQPLMQM